MSNVITLDYIKQAAEKKFGSTVIPLDDTEDGPRVELVNAVRLPKKRRDEVITLQKSLSRNDDGSVSDDDEEEVDQAEILCDIIRKVGKPAKAVETLIETVGDDLGSLVVIFENYAKVTELGEASASES